MASFHFINNYYLLFQPLLWEYLWCLSLPASFLALRAIKHNCVKNISLYIKWIISLGILPVIYCFFCYLPDVYTFITESPYENVQLWRVSIMLPKRCLFTYVLIFFSILEFSIWYTLVHIYCCCYTNPRFLNIFCTEFEKCLDCQGYSSKKKLNLLL